jgi:Predicted transcriptional regulators containing the CopG/Arc/MetJ DNA-binding domain and a metal-binding domain
MEIIQVVLDKKLLQATDRMARQMKQNRSTLVREALREHLRRIEIRGLEDLDRQGYSRKPLAGGESAAWESEAAWPEK